MIPAGITSSHFLVAHYYKEPPPQRLEADEPGRVRSGPPHAQNTKTSTCVLRVGIKCCKGCQKNAKGKLLNFTGVNAVEYNAEQGLLTVSGNVNPTTLLHKLTKKWGKKAEIVTVVVGDSSAPVPRTPEQNHIKTMEKNKPTKCCLLMCFGKRSREAKVEPLATPNMNYRGLVAENSSAMPFINACAPPIVYPPPQEVSGFATPVSYPPPIFGASHPPQPYNGGMFRSAPPQSPPYFQTQFPQMVNSRLHYPHH